MNIQVFQDPQKVTVIWVKYLHRIANKMNNTKSSMIEMKMKPKGTIKLDIAERDKPNTNPEENVLPQDGLY